MSDGSLAGVDSSYPTEVRRQATDRGMRVTWSDGHISDYPWNYLRGWCPCASCQGHGGDKRYVHTDNPELVNITVVGKYALSLVWADGHDSGIYSYRYLRTLCACTPCTEARRVGNTIPARES